MIIRAVLIVLIVIIVLWFFKQRSATKRQASGKIIVLLLFIFAIIAVLFPNITNDIAHSVGVGRGADLLLYALTITFIVSLLAQYIRRQDEHKKVEKLSRKLALLQAKFEIHNTEMLKTKSKNK